MCNTKAMSYVINKNSNFSCLMQFHCLKLKHFDNSTHSKDRSTKKDAIQKVFNVLKPSNSHSTCECYDKIIFKNTESTVKKGYVIFSRLGAQDRKGTCG